MTERKDMNLVSCAVDRRGLLKCMAWAGTGVIWTMSGGIGRGYLKKSSFTMSRCRFIVSESSLLECAKRFPPLETET